MINVGVRSLSRRDDALGSVASVTYNLAVRKPRMWLSQTYFDRKNHQGFDIMAEEWDNLILLDACRYDMFERANSLDGDLSYRISTGSATPEVLRNNFAGKTYHDTVYVTSNPMYLTEGLEDTFHATVDVWQDDWDEDLNTVTPETMADAAAEAYERYPDKRLLVHFMQPHYPFIGEQAQQTMPEHSGIEWSRRKVLNGRGEHDDPTVWDLLDQGEISRRLAWKAYTENLEVAMPHIERLVDTFEERTVVTSDHGNLVDERIGPFPFRMSGHPEGVYTESLVKVPWLAIDTGVRKDVVSEPPESSARADAGDVVASRLRDLGYAE